MTCLQSHPVAMASAVHTSRIRSSLRRPRRSTSTPLEMLSTESRLIADTRGIGSSLGSRTTSVDSPLTLVVQGATMIRPRRVIAASRESTTTGRRPISGGSDHHTSPRCGSAVTICERRRATTRGRPTRRARRADARRRPGTGRRSLLHAAIAAALRAQHPAGTRHSSMPAGRVLRQAARCRLSCSPVLSSCHNRSMNVLHVRSGSPGE